MTESQLGIAVIGLLGSMLVALLSAILGVALRERKERANGGDTNGKPSSHGPRWAEDKQAIELRIHNLETEAATWRGRWHDEIVPGLHKVPYMVEDVKDHEIRIKHLERE